jgi:hypothetical protein
MRLQCLRESKKPHNEQCKSQPHNQIQQCKFQSVESSRPGYKEPQQLSKMFLCWI